MPPPHSGLQTSRHKSTYPDTMKSWLPFRIGGNETRTEQKKASKAPRQSSYKPGSFRGWVVQTVQDPQKGWRVHFLRSQYRAQDLEFGISDFGFRIGGLGVGV